MPRYLHTGSWANVFHVPGIEEPIEAAPGEVITLANKIEHELLTLVDEGVAKVKATLAELKAYAVEHGIDLGGATKHADVAAAITAAEQTVPAVVTAPVTTETPAVTPEPTTTVDGKE